jgi:hypothetical protein
VILRHDFGRRISRDVAVVNAVARLSSKISSPWPRSLESAFQAEAFREILQPKEDLQDDRSWGSWSDVSWDAA